MPKPPIVWHLDTDHIANFSYNPEDRLTRIKALMIAFEAGELPLKKFLKAVEDICEETNKL